MSKYQTNRREFIRQFSLATLGTTVFSSLFQLKAIGSAFLNNSGANSEYKALVCFFQTGGHDSFNMLIPRGNPEYTEYAATRTNLAIPQADLRVINPLISDGKSYGVHPNMPGVQRLFNEGKLSFLNNIGSLIVPTTKTQYQQGSVPLPLGLYSHSDQIQQWQTASPHQRTPYGWGGKLAALMQEFNTSENISMNISTSGTNVFQYGQNIVEFSVNPYGGVDGIRGYNPGAQSGINALRTQAINALLQKNYGDAYKDTYKNTLKRAVDGGLEYADAIENLPELETEFENNYLSRSFRTILQIIQAREILGFNRQIFYVEYGGWDHHDNMVQNHSERIGIVDNALAQFAAGLEEIGMFDKVTTFNMSEFARTLGSNGNGSDHGWGGNVLVMGGSVEGKRMFGSFPSLALGNNLDVGTGVLIPTLANDLYFAELALWFGVNSSDLPILFPNLSNFYAVGSGEPPIGFMKE